MTKTRLLTEDKEPQLSAVVCTRNRGSRIVATLESILANSYKDFELIVIDQSDDDRTESAVRPYLADLRIRYERNHTVGAGNARQTGLLKARGQVVAYTDDDCLVPPNWLDAIWAIFAGDASIGVVFCSVAPVDHDLSLGTVPHHVHDAPRTIETMMGYMREIGMGAGVALRRDAALTIGGFDRSLGPGSRFLSGEDHDIAIRALLHHWKVFQTPDVVIVHDGFRTLSEFRALTRRDWYAIGAVHAKYVKCLEWVVFPLIPYNSFVRGLLEPFKSIGRGKRPTGFKRFIYYWEGFVAGLRSRVDRDNYLYASIAADRAQEEAVNGLTLSPGATYHMEG